MKNSQINIDTKLQLGRRKNNLKVNRVGLFFQKPGMAFNSDISSTEINYISTPTGLGAVYVEDANGTNLYFSYTDHQGSITKLTDQDGNIVHEQTFDVWGKRTPLNPPPAGGGSANPNNPDFSWLRGYTGHEHLEEFDLINMNGRLYDPSTARMLSPDNFVQSPFYSQNYNRYSYVYNNPLKYTDPTGMVSQSAVATFDANWQNSQAEAKRLVDANLAFQDWVDNNRLDFDKLYDETHLFGGGGDDGASNSNSSPSREYLGVRYIRDVGIVRMYSISAKSELVSVFGTAGLDYKFHSGILQHPFSGEQYISNDIWNRETYSATGIITEGHINRTKLALGAGGSIYGALEHTVAGEGYWLGKNGKYYTNMTGRGPNGVTGSRSGALRAAKIFRWAGAGTFVISGAISAVEGYNHLKNENYAGASKSGLDIIMGGVSFTGPIGWVVSGTYFIVDSTIGWNNALKSQESMVKQNQAILGPSWSPFRDGGYK